MAKNYYEGTDYNINTNWGGDESTGGLPLPGSAVQDIIKTNIKELNNTKIGYVTKGEGVDNNKILFHSEKSGETLYTIELEPLYSISVTQDLQNRYIYFTGENDKNFIWYFKTIKISDKSTYVENVSVTYKINTGGSNKTYELILNTQNLTSTNEGYKVVLDLNQYLIEGNSSIEIIVNGLTTKQTANLPKIDITITKLDVLDKTDFSKIFDETISLAASVDCVDRFTFYYRFDNDENYEQGETYENGVNNIKPDIDISGLDDGIHVIEYKVGLLINGIQYDSKIQRIEFIKNSKDLTLLTQTSDYLIVDNELIISNIYTYTDYKLRCAVFDGDENKYDVRVNVKENGTNISIQDIKAGEVNDLTFNFETEGLKEIEFKLEYDGEVKTRTIKFDVKSLEIGIKMFDTDLVIDFDSSTKIGDNSVDTREIWENKVKKNLNIKPVFKNFTWSEGWSKNGLVITNGSELSFNYAPFPGSDGSYIVGKDGENSYTIEIEFMTQNVTDENAVLCDMMGNDCGLKITASEIKFKITEGKEVGTRFIPNELNHCAILIRNTKNSAGKYRGLVELYVNGVICGISAFENERTFVVRESGSFEDKNLSFFGAEGADFILKRIRTYQSVPVNRDSIVNNFILQRSTGNEKMTLFNNNLISDENGNITPETVAQLGNIPILIFIGRTVESELATGDGNETENEPYKYGKINAQNAYWYETLEKTKDKNKEIEMDVIYYNPKDKTKNFKFVKARVRPQGTSSMLYPKKNFRIYTQKTNDTRCFFSTEDKALELKDMLYSKFGEREEDRVWEKYRGTKNYKKRKYSFKDGAQPVKCWCLKADFAETSSSHNTGIARLWNTVMKKSTVDDIAVFKTNAQEIGENNGYKYDIRTTIDGFPIVVFGKRCYADEYNEEGNIIKTPYVFLGKYNFNNDKSTESVFGFCDIDNDSGHTIPRKCVDYSKDGYNTYDELSEEEQKELEAGVTSSGFTLDDMLDKYMTCVETLDNGNILGNFGSMESEDGKPWDESWDKAFEFRYQEIPEEPQKTDYQDENGNWGGKEGNYEDYIKDLDEYNEKLPKWKNTRLKPFKHFADWLYSTKWCDINGNILQGISEEEAKLRKDKFAKEKWLHLDIWKVAAYYVYAMRFGAVDQLVKNSMLTSEGPFAYDAKLQKKGYWDCTPIDNVNYGKYYKWYFINYDNDTILGLKNDGRLVYDPYITRQSVEGSGVAKTPIYAGSESTLWNNLENDNEFINILRTVDQSLSSNLNYTDTINMFNINQVGQWCERFYNKDAEYKYISPYLNDKEYDTGENSSDSFVNKMFMLQGSRTAHRKWWLTRRFDLFDGRWGSGGFNDRYIEVKCDTASIGDKFEAVVANNGYFGYTINGQTFKGSETVSYNKGDTITWELQKILNVGDPIAIYNPQNISELKLGNLSKYLTGIAFKFEGAENNLNVIDLSISEELLTKESYYYDIFSDVSLGDGKGEKDFFEDSDVKKEGIKIEDFENKVYETLTNVIEKVTEASPKYYRLKITYGEKNDKTTYSYFKKVSGYFRNYSLSNNIISFAGLNKLQELKLAGFAALTEISLTDSQAIKNVDTRYSNIGSINLAENAQIETLSASSALTNLVFNGCNNIKFSGITIDEKTLDKSNSILNINIINSTNLTNNKDFKDFIINWVDNNVNNTDSSLMLYDINWENVSLDDLRSLYSYIIKRNGKGYVKINGKFILGYTSITREDLELIENLKSLSDFEVSIIIPFTYISANINGTSGATIVAGETIDISFESVGTNIDNDIIYECNIVEEINNVEDIYDSYLESNGKYYKKVEPSQYRGAGNITISRNDDNNKKFTIKTTEVICHSDTELKLAVVSKDRINNMAFDFVYLKILDPTYPVKANIIGTRSINSIGEAAYELSLLTDKDTVPNGNITVTWQLSGNVSDYIVIDSFTDNGNYNYTIKDGIFEKNNKVILKCIKLPDTATVALDFYFNIKIVYTERFKDNESGNEKTIDLTNKFMILNEDVILTDASNPVVFDICQRAEWITEGVTYMTKTDAKKVREIENKFSNITDESWSFEEFEYFTGLTEIPTSAFYGSNIIKIKLPNTIENIGDSAFENCHILESVDFNNCKISAISARMFLNAKNIKNIYLPRGINEIKNFAFGNTGIKKICNGDEKAIDEAKTIYLQSSGESGFLLEKIQNNAFESEDITPEFQKNQKNGNGILNKSTNVLNEVFLPDRLNINNSTYNFLSSEYLAVIKIKNNSGKFKYENGILYDNNSSKIYRAIYTNDIEEYKFEGISQIFPFAFAYNKGMYKVECNDAFLTTIGAGCFYKSNITAIDLKSCSNLALLDDYTFYDCKELTEVKLPDNLRGLGYRLFNNCTKLAEITLPDTIEYCKDISLFGYQFNNCGITGLTIPNNLLQVPFYFVSSCNEFKEIRFSKYFNLSYNNNHQLFVDCAKLEDIYLPLFSKNVKEEGEYYVYKDNKVLCSPYTEDEAKDIVYNLEQNKPSELKNVVYSYKLINNSYLVINNSFYNKGSNETFIRCNSINKFVLHEDDNNLIMETRDGGKSIIRVGNGNLTNNTITKCEPKLVKVVYSTTDYTLPEDIEEIENGAFAGCNNLSNVKLNDILETIGSYAFASCGKLEHVDLPNTLTSIGDSTFRGCGLKEIIVPENVNIITEYLFANCINLETIEILSSNLISIARFAFNSCKNLQKITILTKNAPELKTGSEYYTYIFEDEKLPDPKIYTYHPFGYNKNTIVGIAFSGVKKLCIPYDSNGYKDNEKWAVPLLTAQHCNFVIEDITLEDDIAVADESLNNMDMVYIKRETNDNIEPLAVLSPYNEGDSKRIAMFNSEKIYHGETIVVYSDEECNNEVGRFVAKYGTKIYNLTKDIVMGSTYSNSLFNRNIFEDEQIVENSDITEMANITKHEYKLLLAKVNQLMKLLNKKK